jgi:predicted Ser/Thr protein kinase
VRLAHLSCRESRSLSGEEFAMPDVSAHPTAQQLVLFGHGRLPQAQAATVAAHLETCADCRQAVANLPPDSFFDKVRGARTSATVPPSGAPAAEALRGAVSGPAAADVPPQLANHPKFRIVRELGRGGMGVIYLAEHRVMDKPVALKVISPSVLDNPTAVARFLAEVRAAGKLDHPNIARAYDADQAGGLHFLVMEYVEGQSLAQVLEKRGPLPVAGACHCVCQAALGLQHASEKGMAHRDVKPQNLMLTPKGVVKVLDFGLARLRGERKGGSALTQADSFMGTPEYVAPEQATDARNADTRSDIYSLGCTLYALLTGRPPFREDTMVKLVMAHIEKEPRPLNEVRPDVPAEMAAVVAKMLAKDPARRYQRPIEVAQALAPFAKVRVPGAAPKSPAPGSAGTGTVVGGDTSRDGGPGAKAPKLPAAPREDTEASPFAGLDDDPDPARPAKKAKQPAAAKPGPAPWWKRRAVLASGGAGVALLLVLVVLWAAGVFRVKTADGTILIVEVNEPNPDVFVDGEKVTVTWDAGGKKAEVRVKPGTRKVVVSKDGFTAYGEEVEIKDGTRRILTARLGPAGPGDPAPDPAAFFNGKSLVGWDYLPGYWGVRDGAIVGTCALDKPLHTFLCSSKSYKDFDLKFKARRKDGRGATAVQFRSQVMDRATFGVIGPYCEIGAPHAAYPPGSLLIEPIAAFKPVKAREAVSEAYRDSDFNAFHIRCVGKHVTIRVNGVAAVDGDYSDVPDEGIIAWQFNGWRPPSEVTFKDIEFKELK